MVVFLNFLLSMANEQDREKIIYIYEHFHDDMVSVARGRLKEAKLPNYYLDAEDIVQETFLRLVKYIGKVDMSMGEQKIRSYVITVLINVITDFVSHITYVEDISGYEDILFSDDDFIEELNVRERLEEIKNAVDQLNDIYKITFSLKYLKNMETEAIADFMGVSAKTVYTRLYRGKQLLMDILAANNTNV